MDLVRVPGLGGVSAVWRNSEKGAGDVIMACRWATEIWTQQPIDQHELQ